MKKNTNLILAPLVALATSGHAQTQPGFAYAVKEVKVDAFRQLSVKAGLDVVLVQNNEMQLCPCKPPRPKCDFKFCI